MSIDLKPYQEKAVDKLIETTVKLLSYDGPGEVCVFQALFAQMILNLKN